MHPHATTLCSPAFSHLQRGDQLVITAEEAHLWALIKKAIEDGKKVQVEMGRDGIKLIAYEPKVIK